MNLDANKIASSTASNIQNIIPKLFSKWLIVGLVGVIILLYVATTAFVFGSRLQKNWNEVAFAYQHPQLVKVMRTQYQGQVAKVETSLAKQKLSPEDKVLQDISDQLKAGSK